MSVKAETGGCEELGRGWWGAGDGKQQVSSARTSSSRDQPTTDAVLWAPVLLRLAGSVRVTNIVLGNEQWRSPEFTGALEFRTLLAG